MKKLLFLLSFFVGVLLCGAQAHADTFTVCSEMECDAPTITDALGLVNTVTGGDVIQVGSSYDPAGETYPFNFPDVTTTLACDGGATIGQTNLGAPSSAINLSTSSTIRDCTFGQVLLMTKNVGMGSEIPSGIRIENNAFSTESMSAIYLYRGATNFVIEGNRNINYLASQLAWNVADGVIQNNSFYGRMGSGQTAYMLYISASSSNIGIYNNDFTSYTDDTHDGARTPVSIDGTNMIFATNTVKYASGSPVGTEYSVIFSPKGTSYFGGNKVRSPSSSDCQAVVIYPSIGSGPVVTNVVFNQNSIVMKCGGMSSGALSISDGGIDGSTLNVTVNNSLFSAGNGARGISVNTSGDGSTVNVDNDWNGFYRFNDAIDASGLGVTATLGEHTFYRDPFFMTDDVALGENDLDVAPFSFYLDALGHRIGATTSTRRTTTNIVAEGTIDYIAVDATTTTKIPEYVSSGDTVDIAAGTYRAFEVDDSNGLSDILIRGSGASTIIDARTNEDGILFANVTTSAITQLTVKNASTTSFTYELSRAVYHFGDVDYGEAIIPFELAANTPLFMTGEACDFEPYDDGTDVTAFVNAGVENWHVALVAIEGMFHETLVIPGDFADSQLALDAICEGGDMSITVEHFIPDVFVRSGESLVYSASAISGAGAVLEDSIATPAITAAGGSHAGIKLVNSGSVTISQVTSTDNGYGIWFADTSTFGNSVTSTVFANNTLYDVRHDAEGRNTFDNVSFTRASSTLTSVGDLLVKFNTRVRTLIAGTSTAISDASVTTTSAIPLVTDLGVTDGSGYSTYLSLPAYTLTSTTNSEVGGGFNPRLFAASIAGYNTTSTLENLNTVNQTVTLGLLDTALPEVATGPIVSAIGTTSSTFSWTDGSDNEDGFYVGIFNLSTGELTTVTVAADATSYAFTGLTPAETYIATVRPFNLNGAAVVASSSPFVTLPVTPTPPDLHGMSLTSVAITRVNANTNSTSTEYAIYDVTAARYRDASGVATTTAVWQTTSTWDVLLISGLTCGTNYGFATIARNADEIQSATSTVGTISTVDCEPVVSSGGGGGGGALTTPFVSSPQNIVPPPVPTTVPREVTILPTPEAKTVWPTDDAVVLTQSLQLTRDIVREERAQQSLQADMKQFRVVPTEAELARLANFVAYGNSWATIRLGEGERRAVVRDCLETMRTAAISDVDLDRVTRGLKPLYRNLEAEKSQLQQVRQTFRTLYGQDPNFKNTDEDLAWNTLMYRIRYSRDLAAEKEGIIDFKKIFNKVPQTPFQWATVRVLGYVK